MRKSFKEVILLIQKKYKETKAKLIAKGIQKITLEIVSHQVKNYQY